jgi:dipeptidase D
VSFVATLEPRELWQHFDHILTIPRGSKNEDAIRRYVLSVADRKGLAHDTDAAGNVIVRKPGQTNAAVVILQGHLDMVNEKNSNVVHDFTKDAIQPQHAGEYLTATGTTLGSDNGIGVAAMLALMESTSVAHGPLEFLFTIDEETGLTGAAEVDATLLTGRRLINLDSEEENTVTVGCAGGASSTLRLPLQTQPTGSAAALTVRLHGLRGGHSGIDIHLQRGNALKLLVRMLHAAHLSSPLRIADLVGGNMHNAIPREASAVVVIDAKVNDVREALQAEFSGVRAEYASADPDMELVVQDAELPGTVWTAETTSTALALLEALPHGVLAMSLDIPGLVETSTNAATARVAEGRLIMLMSNRSSVASALRAVRRRIRAIAQLAGADVQEATGYPGWKPDLSSQLLQVVREVHKQTLGSDPEIKAVHAGLECGIIGEKIVGMDMISFGPQIEFPHSPNERVHIESVARFYRLLIATLERLAR